MPKCLKNYKDPVKAKQYRDRQRKMNYERTNIYPPKGLWASWEDELVLAHAKPDRELSAEIKRSVRAIQIRRSKLKKFLLCNES